MQDFLNTLKINETNSGVSTGSHWFSSSINTSSASPVDGKTIGTVQLASGSDYETIIQEAQKAFAIWRSVPAPKRGDVIRQVGDGFRRYKKELGSLISYETGKSLQEGLGEVQEVIDICDFASGLSRQISGLTMHSERPLHRMYEQYHPLGIVGIITAFNFPAAVWAWNSALAWVCGDVTVWKPSPKAPLTAIACQKITAEIFTLNQVPEAVSSLLCGNNDIGELLSRDTRIPLVSATGSTAMGRKVAVAVAQRLGRSLLELGGNNAIIITPDADLQLALTASVFGAVGTAGQRCTSTRRLIIHSSIYDTFKNQLVKAYHQLKIGNPLEHGIHMGPLIDKAAVEGYLTAIDRCKEEGGAFLVEGGLLEGYGYESGCYVKPCIAEVNPDLPIVREETFAPILYIMKYETIEEAIAIQNGVSQGLSSAIMSTNLRETELFLSSVGSDCGIANVNIGTSGAEIGGAFGGEKDSGGGRESGSDSWKAYMRRQTNTINFGNQLPLAQGIKFDL
ncbi:L-piperidine-6-carboxylate dehydrogenase [Desertivirga arenae]|uniref:L-piperidine-6-carboxylate dehydrogenase n=1 Tax=Desertivirga arenae TaxID=2810309 RepID=UPI001A956CAC|nr:aldehyde dehydrogenase family protein [Pedobacter sp. SYSU D00823]